MSAPDWKNVLPAPPNGTQLLEAWFTTYDQPDAGLMVEHLLPSLLGTSYSLSQELHERTLFFGELGMALETLHGRITVISSPPRKSSGVIPYPWLWRYVNHFTVGANANAVQHAKLWAFHWKADDKEFLELHISSTNLTASAFKGQVQAGWSACVQLEEKFTKSRLQGWGELVPFLEALGESAGNNAKLPISRFIQLLGKVECPNGVMFVASTPGSNKRAALTLKKIRPTAIHILSPTIGDWSQNTLNAWSKDFSVSPQNIHLKWLAEDHPWAGSGGWTLTNQARKTLQGSSVKLNHLTSNARFTNKHADADERWSHAKLYLLRNKKKRFLLVTSANWSPSAWGAGKMAPNNFELGVLFETDWKMLEDINGDLSVPFCTERECDGDSKLQWAEVNWDGRDINLHARSSDSATQITATVSFTDSSEKVYTLKGRDGSIAWKNTEIVPLMARLTQGVETLEINVVDLRPPAEFANTPLPEVDPTLAVALREAFLLQRYGGPAVDADTIAGFGSKHRSARIATPVADYSVQAWVEARAAFDVVDNWRKSLSEAKGDHVQRDLIMLDGQVLQEIYNRMNDAASSLVAQELDWRLKEKTCD